MKIRVTPPPPTRALTRAQAEELAGRLVDDMTARWRQGEHISAEDFLARYPVLIAHPEAAADLIYEEMCLRQEFGLELPTDYILARFPQWRRQLELLFDCQRVLGPRAAPPQFPAAGEKFGDFLLLQELGRGAHGRVFLASQVSLGDRPVVLKVAPLGANEHLSLARVQHTYIVPLHSIHDDPARQLRGLCMPYFGGITLAQLLDKLRATPIGQRSGKQIAELLERSQPRVTLAVQAPARQALASATYVEAICWIGVCLAEALHYAHERGLVHLDLKPSNILLAADGQPMLLDFHLSRGPIVPEEPGLDWLGGTLGYMSPEQEAAIEAARLGQSVTRAVDGRSDQFSLGLVLSEALTGELATPDNPIPLHRAHPAMSVGLSDIVARCLAPRPERRYATLAHVAADLRRHLEQLPLLGVHNRSWRERWQKWRRRRPHGVALATMMLALLTATGTLALGTGHHFQQRTEEARHALHDGQARLSEGQPEAAVALLQRGLNVAQAVPFQGNLVEDLNEALRQAAEVQTAAERSASLRELHRIAELARFLYGLDSDALRDRPGLDASCRALWQQRTILTASLASATPAQKTQARDDVLELAILWANLQARLLPAEGACQRAQAILTDAEKLLGSSPVLAAERQRHGGPFPGDTAPLGRASPWEHYALGRALLKTGAVERAARELTEAVRGEPQGLWPNFYLGQCAMQQGRYSDAVLAYSVCIGAAPNAAGCFYHRALAYAALGQTDRAEQDLASAVRLDPALGRLPVGWRDLRASQRAAPP